VAAGGIADGRGIAAALCLGAQAVNLGTRFLASLEAPIDERWQRAILAAESQDSTQVRAWNEVLPVAGSEFPTAPRTLTSPFVETWGEREAERLRGEIRNAVADGRLGDLLPFAGQTAGLIRDLLPAGEIVTQLAAEAAAVLGRAAAAAR
jgi:NAD(P)H-dependent flavin oxidoreductase YrpB (nitropropane dioxygenase family)